MMLNQCLKLALVWVIVGALGLPATSAMADEVEEEAVAGSEAAVATEEPQRRGLPSGLEEITVTGRKKESVEALQEVPISVSAFTGNYLEQNFVESLEDLSRSAPNVQLSAVGTFPGTANFSIRGNAIFSSIISDEPLVGIFVDGVYAGMNVAAIHDLFEIQTVEIYRGPQGTLFGRNVTGGSLNVRTRRPSGEFGVRGRFTVGSFSRSDAALSVEAPINEELAWKIDMLSKDRNGMWDNNNTGGEHGNARSWTFRPMVSWSPTEDLQIEALYEVIQSKSDGNAVRYHECTAPTKCVPNGALPNSARDTGPFDLHMSNPGDFGFKVQRATVEGVWDVGPGTLTSITGWRNVSTTNQFDVDGIPEDYFQGGPTELTGVDQRAIVSTYQWQISSELRYAMQIGERADLTTGLFYFKQDMDYREPRRLFVEVIPPDIANGIGSGGIGEPNGSFPLGGTFAANKGELDHQSAAWFVQGDYDLTDQLTMTLGTRYTWEEKVGNVYPSTLGDSLCNQEFTECLYGDPRRRQDQDTWDYWSHHAGLRYQVNDDLMVYGSYTRSFRAGGYNLRASSEIPFSPYDEERIDAYEVGLKGDWLNNTLRTNLTGFYNRGKDIQRTILTGVIQDQSNAAKGHVAGFEGEVWWLPIEGLTLNTTVGWVDAEYDNFAGVCSEQTIGACAKGTALIADLNVTNPGEGSGEDGLWVNSDVPAGVGRGLDYAYVPEWTWSAMGRYEFPVPVLLDGTVAVQASVYWRDDTWGNDQNTVPVDSYTIWDASITYFSPDDRYQISVFGKNLTQDPYHNFGIYFNNNLDWNAGPPRRFGVEVSFNY